MTENELMGTCTALEAIVERCNLTAVAGYGQFQKAFAVADGVGRLRSMITGEHMKPIMSLQNSSLGFRTDNQNGYAESVVKDCLIEAVLRGVNPVGNQFNIISGRCYITKEGFSHLLKNLPDLTDLRVFLGVPKTAGDKGAIVTGRATWKIKGAEYDLAEREIPVKINSGMGADAILGKAERKIKAAIFAQITGTNLSDGEADDHEAIQTTATRKAPEQPITEPAQAEGGMIAELRAQLMAANSKDLAQARGNLKIATPIEKLSVDEATALLEKINHV